MESARPVPLGGPALPAPRRQSMGGAAAKALSAGLDPGRVEPGDDYLGGETALSLYRTQYLDRGDQEDLGTVRQSRTGDRLRFRPRKPRLPAAGPCLRQRGESREERPPVPVDAG